MYEKLEAIEQEIGKVIKGKKDVIRKVLMAICASGHVLLEDHPGSGKTGYNAERHYRLFFL